MLKERINGNLKFIQVIIGLRQVGKSTAIKQLIDAVSCDVFFYNCDSVIPHTHQWLSMQWQEAARNKGKTLLVFDEIQKIVGWSEVVKSLYDASRSREDFYVVLLGSASLTIQQGLNDSLAGRYELIEAHHWFFSEAEKVFGVSIKDYLKFGGYPAAYDLISDTDRWQSFMQNSIVEPVIGKDLQGLAQIKKPALFRQAFELTLRYPAQEISYQKMLGQIQGRGNVATIKHYLKLFEGAFLIKILEKYSGSTLRMKTSSPKIIVMDTGLLHAFKNPDMVDTDAEYFGRVFENAIGAHLAKQNGRLSYWRKGPMEVDFVWQTRWGNYAIEVKSGRLRNLGGPSQMAAELPDFIPVVIDFEKGCELLSSRVVTKKLMDSFKC